MEVVGSWVECGIPGILKFVALTGTASLVKTTRSNAAKGKELEGL